MPQSLIAQLAGTLFSSKELETVAAKLETGRDATIGVPLSARPLLLAATYVTCPRSVLVIVSGEETSYLFARDLALWLGNDAVLQLPLKTDIPWRDEPRTTKHIQEVGQRARAITALANGEPRIVVASARALLRCVPPLTSGSDGKVVVPLPLQHKAATEEPVAQEPQLCYPDAFAPFVFTVGEELCDGLTYDQLSDLLVSKGYERLDRLDHAELPGSFSLHGDTLDIYPAGYSYPVRIELFGEYVEVIRRLVPTSGQSIGMLERVEVYPAREVSLTAQTAGRAARRLQTLVPPATPPIVSQTAHHIELMEQGVYFNELECYLPYLYTEPTTPLAYLHRDTLVALIEPRSLFDDSTRYYEELESHAKIARVPMEGLYTAPADLDFGTQQRLTLLSLISGGASLDARLEVKHADVSSDERLVASARSFVASSYTTVLCVADRHARLAAELVLSDAHIPFASWKGQDGGLKAGVLNTADVDLATPLVIPAAKLGLLSLTSGSSAREVARRGRRGRAVDPTSLTFPFKPGDYVVHETHGIALFKAIVRQEVAGIERDYLHLEYAHGDKLFTPVEQIDKITRFVGPESTSPRLTRLNTSDWSRATGKARAAAKKLAFDLVDLYARRSTAEGYAYPPDNDLQYQIELAFPYEETSDQLAAIADAKADLESNRPMDRLICGDVGFGKTEVALRAAFKVVQSGKQVLMLCPTTILAQQHYTTAFERFESFGVETEVLSRFRTAGQQKRILERLAEGSIDVLVGTHRLLSADINPKNLGLIIIDEEQRFGVQHKEQFKNLREQIDVLTLSATPIPRTLQMAISGVRDMSLIETPPASRTPIQVHVGEWDEDVVSAAIRREMERGGQVYYVSNRVKSIDDAVARVMATAPEVKIGVAHGKMTPTQLENVMEGFAANEYNVLVATTIIESGLDNPHTNTLIIEDSQRLGLAQLYQLKGRVGRSHNQAYAYFLFPSEGTLTEEAIARLTAIDEFQGLGSGMKIAMRDLEIRGAGSLLGAEQHGMLSAVGFDLFASMLQEAVLAARSSGTADNQAAYPEVRIDLAVPFILPEEYVPAADERVLFYRRIAAATDLETVSHIEAQLLHAYGALPAPAQNLIDRAQAKVLAAELGVTTITVQRGKFNLEPLELTRQQAAAMKARGGIYLVKTHKLMVPPQQGVGLLAALLEMLASLQAEEAEE